MKFHEYDTFFTKILTIFVNVVNYPHNRKFRKAIKHLKDPLVKRDNNTMYIGDVPFKILKETKYNVILYNEINNNIIITDNYNKTINDITEIFMDVRFYSLYYKVINSKNLVVVIRSDEGLTNDYHVFEKMDVSSIISNKISFESIFNSLNGKESYFLG